MVMLETLQTELTSGTYTMANKTLTNPTINFTDKAVVQNVKFRAYPSAAQTVATGGFVNAVLDQESFDTGSDFNTTTYAFTAPVTGYYLLLGAFCFANVGDGSPMYVRFSSTTNGGGTNYAQTGLAGASVGDDPSIPINALLYLTATSTVYMSIYQNSGGNLDTINYTFFSGVLLST